ncbi:hypothetical protein [Sphingomonas morindae]|uniref:Secreted protein n=1 Tax=Sphingomonas morindae TaxID=1541170 RepID=A0ABY4X8I9_9SPHN|nr:hypothetical protein [Sphingomonas morindae]USI73155.1 hypothetical protein LHA26_01340 [Sphingomonas morindae]
MPRTALSLPLLLATLATPLAARPASLDATLAGRTAGAPRSCLPAFLGDRGSQSFPGALLYGGSSSTIYLNRLPNCTALTPDRVVVIRSYGSGPCRGDIVEVRERFTPVPVGSCALGDFIPYSKPRHRAAQ